MDTQLVTPTQEASCTEEAEEKAFRDLLERIRARAPAGITPEEVDADAAKREVRSRRARRR